MVHEEEVQGGSRGTSISDATSDVTGRAGGEGDAVDDGTGTARRSRRGGRLRWLALPAIIAVVGFSIVLAQGLDRAQDAPSPLIGKSAPRFVLPTISGDKTLDSAKLAGAVVVVNFWASWCIPCRDEAQNLESFARHYENSGVVLVGILYSDTLANARDFRDEFGLTYPLVDDADGRTSIAFGVRGVPETFVIAPDGRVMARLIGAVGPSTLDEVLQRVLGGETVTSKNDQYRSGPTPAETTEP